MSESGIMRTSYKTSELICGILGLLVISLFSFNRVTIEWFSAGVVLIFNIFIISRTLFKRNRGLSKSSFKSAEFVAFLLSELWVILAQLKLGLNPRWAFVFFLVNPCVYMLCRGFAKNMGMRTQHVFR